MNDNTNDFEQRKARFLQSHHSVANCLQHVYSYGNGIVVCKSRTHILGSCHMQSCATWYGGTAQQ